MRHLLPVLPFLLLAACQPRESSASKPAGTPPPAAVPESPPEWDATASVVRVNATLQSWSLWQPWEKNAPQRRRALAAIIGPDLVVTTAEMVADSTYLEFESADGSRFARARVIAVDYEVNLALLGPASKEEGAAFFAGTVPFEITTPSGIGDKLQVLQVEDSGLPILSQGTLQSVEVSSSLLAAHSFLTYQVKASMQSASSSYTLPVLSEHKLAGVLLGYNSKDQICNVVSTEILARFASEAADGVFEGFPSLGVSIARTEDTSFRKWLKLSEDQGGLYINAARETGAAYQAGVRKGDVLLSVDGQTIDRRGYYQHARYGSLSWGHLVRGERSSGDTVTLGILRNGEKMDLPVVLRREDDRTNLVPRHVYDKAPNFLVKGGLVFQELTRPVLESFGDEWRERAPLNLLDILENPETYEDGRKRVVFLSGAIPTPATIGYERLRNLVVTKVNGRTIKDMKELIDAFGEHGEKLHSIEFADENLTIHLNDEIATAVDTQLLQRGISRLSRHD